MIYHTEAAMAAKAIRSDLKKAFPKTKFKIHSQTYSMGDDVNVSYFDGPTEKQVEEVVRKYQSGYFDGMTDMYEYSNNRHDIPQTKYLFIHRDYSESVRFSAWENIEKSGLGHTCRGWEEVEKIGPYDKNSAINYELREKEL